MAYPTGYVEGIMDRPFTIFCFQTTSCRSLLNGIYSSIVQFMCFASIIEQTAIVLIVAVWPGIVFDKLGVLNTSLARHPAVPYVIVFMPYVFKICFVGLAWYRVDKEPPISSLGYSALALGCGYRWGLLYGSLIILIPMCIGDLATAFVFQKVLCTVDWAINMQRINCQKLNGLAIVCISALSAFPTDVSVPLMSSSRKPGYILPIGVINIFKMLIIILIGRFIAVKFYFSVAYTYVSVILAVAISTSNCLFALVHLIDMCKQCRRSR